MDQSTFGVISFVFHTHYMHLPREHITQAYEIMEMMANHIWMWGILVMFVRMVWVYCVLALSSSMWHRPPSIEFLLGDT